MDINVMLQIRTQNIAAKWPFILLIFFIREPYHKLRAVASSIRKMRVNPERKLTIRACATCLRYKSL